MARRLVHAESHGCGPPLTTSAPGPTRPWRREPGPQVNVPVLDEDGRFVALSDMVYVAERVAIEYDGDVHRTDARTWRRDVAKRQWLEDLGWRTVVATADDVYRHPSRLVARVAALLRSRAVPGRAEK